MQLAVSPAARRQLAGSVTPTAAAGGRRRPAGSSPSPTTIPPTVVPARKKPAVRRQRATAMRVQALAGNGGNAGNLVAAVSALLTALGIPNSQAAIRSFLKRGLDGGGGGDAGDLAARLIDYYFWPLHEFLPLPCVPCDAACAAKRVIVDVDRVARAAEALTRAIDAALRRYRGTSLLQYLHGYLVRLIDAKLASKRVPVLRLTGIAPVLGLGPLLQYDVTRGARLKILEWVFAEYVEYYLPRVKFNVRRLNAELFSKYRPQIIAFLRGRDVRRWRVSCAPSGKRCSSRCRTAAATRPTPAAPAAARWPTWPWPTWWPTRPSAATPCGRAAPTSA